MKGGLTSGDVIEGLSILLVIVFLGAVSGFYALLVAAPLYEALAVNRSPETVRLVLATSAPIAEVDEFRRVVKVVLPPATRELTVRYGYAHEDRNVALTIERISPQSLFDVSGAPCAVATYAAKRDVEIRVRLLDDRCVFTVNARNLFVTARFKSVKFGVYEVNDYVVFDVSVGDHGAEGEASTVALPVYELKLHDDNLLMLVAALLASAVFLVGDVLFVYFLKEEDLLAFVITTPLLTFLLFFYLLSVRLFF